MLTNQLSRLFSLVFKQLIVTLNDGCDDDFVSKRWVANVKSVP